MYTPTLARFTSRDPLPDNGEPILGGLPNATASMHAYAYARNNPVNLYDPSGKVPVGAIIVGCRLALWYGKYCGPGTVNGRPQPDDDLDACCQAHDDCYIREMGEWWNSIPGYGTPKTILCDTSFCACVEKVDCGKLPWYNQPRCEIYKREALGYYC